MDPALVNNTLQQINSQISNFIANPAIPLDQKNEATRWRNELDRITQAYQRDSERLWKRYDDRYKAKGDEIQRRISDITQRTT